MFNLNDQMETFEKPLGSQITKLNIEQYRYAVQERLNIINIHSP
jgi:hypothetical protein